MGKGQRHTYRVNPAKIVISGESAGGFLVNYAATHETPETRVAAVVDFYGVTDYDKVARQRQAYPARFNMASINGHQKTGGGIWFFGVDGYDEASFAKLKAISPLYAVHKGMAPFLEIHGTRDDQVPYEQSTLMCEAMHKVGARCDVITVEAGGHGMSSWKDPDQQHYKAEMVGWLKKILEFSSFNPRGFAPRTPLHALSRAASPARSARAARSLSFARIVKRAAGFMRRLLVRKALFDSSHTHQPSGSDPASAGLESPAPPSNLQTRHFAVTDL